MNKKEEIFTIGDKTNNGTISKFEIDSNGIRVFFEEKPKNYHVSLNTIKHAKKVLFLTEDDVDIFKGDEITSVNLDTLKLHATTPINTGESLKYGNYKHFSTKEKAEEYVLMNKPCLSIKDICPVIGRANNTTYIDLEQLTVNLKNLVKSKL